MDTSPLFEIIKNYVSLNGVPRNDAAVNEAVQELTGFDLNVQNVNHLARFTHENDMFDKYASQRQTRRIGASHGHEYIGDHIVYIGRNQTRNRGIMGSYMYDLFPYMARMQRQIEGPVGQAMRNLPKVVSEMDKFDRNASVPEGVTDDHFFLQVMCAKGVKDLSTRDSPFMLTGMDLKATPNHGFDTSFFDLDKYTDWLTPFIEEMTTEGWDVISRKLYFHKNGEPGELELPIGAIPPESDERANRHAVMFFNPANWHWPGHIALELIYESVSRDVAEEEVPSEEAYRLQTLFRQSQLAAARLDNNVRDMRQRIENRRINLEDTRRTLASLMRVTTEEEKQMTDMEQSIDRLAVEGVMDIARLPEILVGLRQIDTCHIDTENNQLVIEFVTHPFGMPIPATNTMWDEAAGGYVNPADGVPATSLQVVPVKYRLNLMSEYWDQAIIANPVDDPDCRFHPHVDPAQAGHVPNRRRRSGDICWGQAATPLAEAWGRRDWESFIRLLLAWHTQLNAGDRAARPHQIIGLRGTAERTGWQIPDITNIVEEALVEEIEVEKAVTN